MSNPITINEKGSTVVYESPDPTIEDTWTSKRASRQSTKPPRRHSRDDESAVTVRRSILPRLSLSRSPPSVTTPTLQLSPTPTDLTNGSDAPQYEEQGREEIFWPADLVCHTIPHSRVLTYGYDTKIRHWLAGNVSKNTVYDHAWDLLCSLEALRRDPKEICRPILFVAHSLGGILVKEALASSKGCASTKAHLYTIFEATVGVLFFGTPHKGADPRSFFHRVLSTSVQAMGVQVNNQIVNTLMPNNDCLARLRDEFYIMCHERRWNVYSFQEEYGVTGLFRRKVVDDDSSCLDSPAVETKQHISSNHMDMCRFSGLHDPEYLKVAAAMTLILGLIESRTDTTSHEGGFAKKGATELGLYAGAEYFNHELISAVHEEIRDGSSHQVTQSREQEHSSVVNHSIDDVTKRSLIRQLYFTKIDERLTNLTAAQGTTCRWFLDRPEYISWRDVTQQADHGGFLWIKGNPGTGKSTLMKLLFEKSKLDARDDPSQIILSFFFVAQGTIEEKSTMGLYRSLLHQLFEKVTDLKDVLEWMTPDGARGIHQNGWHEEAAKQTLMHAIQKLGNRSLIIFVDALDECDKRQAAGMIYFFEELCDCAMSVQAQMQICLSSRHYPTILVQRGIEVILEHQIEHTEDIRYYIKSRLRLGRSKQAESLQSKILEKSSGIFLWVVLVLDLLNAEYPEVHVSIHAISNRLNEIPPRLGDLFNMILSRDGENLERLQICLLWVLFAVHPLTPQEFYFAIQLGIDKESSICWDREDVELDQMKTFVRTSSKGLAKVTRNGFVQFIHESVRDFLHGKYGGYEPETTGKFVGGGHNVLRDCCLAQLAAQVYQDADTIRVHSDQEYGEALRSTFPFLVYSVENILHHANSAQQHGMGQEEFLAKFPFREWARLRNTLEAYDTSRYTDSITRLYAFAELNLAALIRVLPQESSCFDIGNERYGPPIFAALATDSHAAVEACLSMQTQSLDFRFHDFYKQCRQRGIKWPDFGRNFSYSPKRGILVELITHGDEIISVAYILTMNNILNDSETGHVREHADVDSKDDYNGRTPLSYAAERGHMAVVQLLLATGRVNVDSTDSDYGRTPLIYAAMNGHENIVQLLLSTGQVDVDVKDDYYGRTSLLYAAKEGHGTIVDKLLATGQADIESHDYYGRTPLSYAAERGHSAVVERFLTTAQVDIENKDGLYDRTPLLYAATKHHMGVVWLLERYASTRL